MNKIRFHELDVKSTLVNRRKLKKFLLSLFIKEGVILETLDIIFCKDEFLCSLNKDFLNHFYYTDTISFPLSGVKDALVGEVYISIDRVKDNSKQLKEIYHTELIRIIIHGTLHLCGYFDKPKIAAQKMQKVQEDYLKIWLFHVEQPN